MSSSARKKLQSLFIEELQELRSSAKDFQSDFPSVASNLYLEDGKSRDPHVEHLVQAFAWMNARLSSRIEAEKEKIPRFLLNHLQPNNLASRPCAAIAKGRYDPSANNSLNRFKLKPGSSLAIESELAEGEAKRACKFSNPYEVNLSPLDSTETRYFEDIPTLLRREHPQALGIISSTLSPSSDVAFSSGYQLENEFNFYIDSNREIQSLLMEELATALLGVLVLDDESRVVARLGPESLCFNQFSLRHSVFGKSDGENSAHSALVDYFSFPERFMFFALRGLGGLGFPFLPSGQLSKLRIIFLLEKRLPKAIQECRDFLKLNCFPIVNLFDTTSEPIAYSAEKTKYQLRGASDLNNEIEIIRVKRVLRTERNGSQEELVPYLQNRHLDKDKDSVDRWVVTQDENPIKKVLGNRSWLSIFECAPKLERPERSTLYAEIQVCNREVPQGLREGARLTTSSVTPIRDLRLITKPTNYVPAPNDSDHLWRLLSLMVSYRAALFDPIEAKRELVRVLSLLSAPGDAISERQIRSIREVRLGEGSIPSQVAGWRGFQRSTVITLDLDSNLFEGSVFLFGSVIRQFFSAHSFINTHIVLIVSVDGQEFYRWKPELGKGVLA